MSETLEFSKLSSELTNLLDKETKKKNGIFYSPKTYRSQLLDNIKNIIPNPSSILEPSFGSGEFIEDVLKAFSPNCIHAVELNTLMFSKVTKVINSEIVTLYNEDFLKFKNQIKYDLIIGNPPYVVVKNTPQEFKCITSGRPNLYCWFIYRCIQMLNDEGILAFILPNSIMNSSYYNELRKYVVQHCSIVSIIEFDTVGTKFQETDQSTIGLVLQKTVNSSSKYIVNYGDRIVFSPNYGYLNNMTQYPTLDHIGFKVKTGSIVWNQVKDDLSSEKNDDNDVLIYTSNIKDKIYVPFPNGESNKKKQYVTSTKDKVSAPVILISRGYGNSVYKPNALLITQDDEVFDDGFYVENHINVIYPINDEGREKINKVFQYILSQDCMEFISKYTGNGALSKTEIETILPIKL